MRGRFHFGQTVATAVLLFVVAACLYATPELAAADFGIPLDVFAPTVAPPASADAVRIPARFEIANSSTNASPRGSLACGSAGPIVRAPGLNVTSLPASPHKPFFGRIETRSGDRAPPLA